MAVNCSNCSAGQAEQRLASSVFEVPEGVRASAAFEKLTEAGFWRRAEGIYTPAAAITQLRCPCPFAITSYTRWTAHVTVPIYPPADSPPYQYSLSFVPYYPSTYIVILGGFKYSLIFTPGEMIQFDDGLKQPTRWCINPNTWEKETL